MKCYSVACTLLCLTILSTHASSSESQKLTLPLSENQSEIEKNNDTEPENKLPAEQKLSSPPRFLRRPLSTSFKLISIEQLLQKSRSAQPQK